MRGKVCRNLRRTAFAMCSPGETGYMWKKLNPNKKGGCPVSFSHNPKGFRATYNMLKRGYAQYKKEGQPHGK